jgi:hypothetical protein
LSASTLKPNTFDPVLTSTSCGQAIGTDFPSKSYRP